MLMDLVARIEIINFLIKMASDCNTIFESDIQFNPCKNRPVESPNRLNKVSGSPY